MTLSCRIILVFLVATLLNCASGRVSPHQVRSDLPEELSQEMRDRFDIKEGGLEAATQDNRERNPADFKMVAGQDGKSKKNRSKKAMSAKQSIGWGPHATTPARSFVYPDRRMSSDPIWVGEKLTYTISYLGLPAGEVILEVLPFKAVNGRKVFHLFGHAMSTPLFSVIYRLNDTVESFMDYEGNFSHRFHLSLDEKKQQRDSIELYDSEKRQTFYWSRWEYPDHSKKEVKQTDEIPLFVQDSLSALFYLRTVPLETKAVVSFPLVSEGKSSQLVCTVLRREPFHSPLGQGTAIVVRPEVKYEGVLKKTGDSFIWYSDDERRFPLRMEARVRVGTVTADLRKIEIGSATNRSNASVQH